MTKKATAADPSRALTLLLALAAGVVVANIYYVQPLAGLVSTSYGVPLSSSGLFVTVTQLGYAAGLVFVVPLGDIAENRTLVLGMLGVLLGALVVAALAPTDTLFLLASAGIGLAASAVQVIVPFAGHLASDATRGGVVGKVVSGLLFGIMLSRPLASFLAHFLGAHSIFVASAVATLALAGLLFLRMPTRRPAGMPYLAVLASLGPLLLRTPVLRRRGAYQAAMFGGFSLFWTAVPLYLSSPAFGFNQVGIGLFALVGAGGALVSPWAGRGADGGASKAITAAALIGGTFAFLLAIMAGHLRSWLLLVVAGLVLDVATAANLVVGQREIFLLGPQARGRLNGLFLALFFVGGALGSFVASIAYARGWTAACLVGLAFPVAALGYFATERHGLDQDATGSGAGG